MSTNNSNMSNSGMNNLFNQFIGTETQHDSGKNITGISSLLGRIKNSLPGGLVGGAAAGSIIALLMSNKSSRKFAGTAAKYGGAAVLGGLAFKAYKTWQLNNYDQQSVSDRSNKAIMDDSKPYASHDVAPDYELKLIKTMIASAKADGHIDSDEQHKIFQTITQMNLSSEMKATVFDLLNHPIPVEDITRGVHDIGQRSELFLAACLVVDTETPSVKLHLDQMASALALPQDLKQQIIQQARQAINETQ